MTTRPLIARSKKDETAKPSFDFNFCREEQAQASTSAEGLLAPVKSFYKADKPLTSLDAASETSAFGSLLLRFLTRSPSDPVREAQTP